jgi:hypothetical protein
MCFTGASVPAVPPAPTPSPSLPDAGVQQAGQDLRNKAALAFGASNTILTSPMGLKTPAQTTANSGMKSVLGA